MKRLILIISMLIIGSPCLAQDVDLTPMMELANQWANPKQQQTKKQRTYEVKQINNNGYSGYDQPTRYRVTEDSGNESECTWISGGINAFGVKMPDRLSCN